MGTKTYAQLTAQTDVDDGDLLAIWRSSPLKRITAALLRDYFSGGVVRDTRTSNTILQTTDKAKFIDITSGTFSQTFTAAATLGDGWWCYIRNSGTGSITLNPNGAEEIDGLTSYIMYPAELRLVMCTGAAFFTAVIQPFLKTWTTTDTGFIWPPGYGAFEGLGWGAGGGGSRGNTTQAGNGGGGGACVPYTIAASSVTPGATATVTIPTGGAGATSNNAAGADGGNASIASLVNCYGGGGAPIAATGGGGGGGFSAASAATPGGPSVSGSGPQNNPGFGGATPATAADGVGGSGGYGGGAGGSRGSGVSGGDGGSTLYGGAGGAGGGTGLGFGGSSKFGGNGGNGGSSAAAGSNGTAPGGGGGGGGTNASSTSTNGGNGARGEIRMRGLV